MIRISLSNPPSKKEVDYTNEMKIFDQKMVQVHQLLIEGAMSSQDILDMYIHVYGENKDFMDLLISEFGPAMNNDESDEAERDHERNAADAHNDWVRDLALG